MRVLAQRPDADLEVRARTLLCSYLSRFGLQVHAVADGVQMRQHLDTHHVDLVVLDLMLPGVDGLTLARALRAELSAFIPTALQDAKQELAFATALTQRREPFAAVVHCLCKAP